MTSSPWGLVVGDSPVADRSGPPCRLAERKTQNLPQVDITLELVFGWKLKLFGPEKVLSSETPTTLSNRYGDVSPLSSWIWFSVEIRQRSSNKSYKRQTCPGPMHILFILFLHFYFKTSPSLLRTTLHFSSFPLTSPSLHSTIPRSTS